MGKTFLGKGWAFPVGVGETGHITIAEYEESVRQAIWVILGTAKGERVMRPNFGCGIHDLVFEINNVTTAGRVASEVRDALLRWEPRIDVQHVTVNQNERPELLLITIEYEVRATNNLFNLVFPFYLEMGAVL